MSLSGATKYHINPETAKHYCEILLTLYCASAVLAVLVYYKTVKSLNLRGSLPLLAQHFARMKWNHLYTVVFLVYITTASRQAIAQGMLRLGTYCS